MDPVNKILTFFIQNMSRIRKSRKVPEDFKRQYKLCLARLKNNNRYLVFKNFQYDAGDHPASFIDFECAFAAKNIARLNPASILDIGSYRQFILGLQAKYEVTTLDVRDRQPATGNEIVMTCDAKKLDIPDNSFDAIISLCTLEHFGLGRYGDEFDLDADKIAFDQMVRVLKPGGSLIFTTTINRGRPSVVFNAHRIYDYEMIRAFCAGLECVEECFFSNEVGGMCSFEQVSDAPNVWDVYCGCWIKR